MEFKKLLTADESERAVSPVIGVILMVAITVILAAVIGTFVLGLGDQVQQTSPNAQWDWEGTASSGVDITHTSGDSVTAANVEVSDSTTGGPYCGDGSQWGSGVSEITAGTTCNIGSGNLAEDDELRLIWTAEGGGSSSTLTSYTVPA